MKKINISILIIASISITLFSLLFGPSFINPFSLDDISGKILFQLRMARVVTSFLIGSFLGASGAILLPERLLLAGIGLGFLFTAVLMLFMSLSTNYGMRRALLWIFGDLSMADWSQIPWGVLLISAGLILSISRAKGLNALMLGDEIAHSL